MFGGVPAHSRASGDLEEREEKWLVLTVYRQAGDSVVGIAHCDGVADTSVLALCQAHVLAQWILTAALLCRGYSCPHVTGGKMITL